MLPSLQRVGMHWFQFKEGIASWRGGREWGWGIPCIEQPVRMWGVLCQVPELGTGCAGSAWAVGVMEGDRLSWDTSLSHPTRANPQVDGEGDMVPPPCAPSNVLELL